MISSILEYQNWHFQNTSWQGRLIARSCWVFLAFVLLFGIFQRQPLVLISIAGSLLGIWIGSYVNSKKKVRSVARPGWPSLIAFYLAFIGIFVGYAIWAP